MGDLLLATAGEDVRLWTMPDLNLHSVKNGTNANLTCCACSNNGQMVAYTHENQGINVAFLQDDAPTLTIPTTCEQSNVSFSTNSRFLVSGGKDRVVSLWDIRSRIAKRTYKDHINPISFCIFNFNGNVVASASNQGEIILTEVQSGSPCQPMIGMDTDGITCLGYSHFTRYLLASASNSGVLALWDTKESKLVKSFTEHSASATCLSFSPLNDMLLCSTGLDKRIIFYDVCYKKTVKIINTEGPLTSCEFMHNGTTVAVGSASGHVSIFDLRHGSVPLRVVPGHRTSVRSVSFQKIPKERHPVKRPTGERVTSSISDTQKVFNVKSPTDTFDITSTENYHAKLAVKRSKSFQQSSDVRNTGSFEVQGKTERTVLHANNEAKHKKSTDVSESPPLQEKEVFSSIPIDSPTLATKPMKREKSNLTKHDLKSKANEEGTPSRPRRPSFERSKSGLSRFLLMTRSSEDVFGNSKKKEEPYIPNKKKERSSEDLYSTKKNKDTDKESADGKKGLLSFKSPFKKKGVDSGKRSDESETSSIDSAGIEDKANNYIDGKNRSSNRSNDCGSNRSVGSNRKKSEMSSSPLSPRIKNVDQSQLTREIQNSLRVNSDGTPSPKLSSADNVSTYSDVFQYDIPQNNISREFIERMIVESMEENRIAIHNDMVNLQVEFIRQMEIQKNQIQQMLEHYSVKDDLVKEILRLRVENKMLVTKY